GTHLELGEGQYAVVGEVERMADAEPEAALTKGEAVFPSGKSADGFLQGTHHVVSGTTEELANLPLVDALLRRNEMDGMCDGAVVILLAADDTHVHEGIHEALELASELAHSERP